MELRGPDIENAHAATPKAPSPLPPSTSGADEQAAQLQRALQARLEAQGEAATQLAAAQQQLAASKAEGQLRTSQGELQLERARSAAEAAGLSQAAAMSKLEQEHERAAAEAAARLQAAEDSQLQTQAVMNTFRAEALEAHFPWSGCRLPAVRQLTPPSEQDKDGEKKHARWRLARKASWRVAGDHDGGWRASLDRFFALSERGSSLRNEALAGFVCFLANAYQARP